MRLATELFRLMDMPPIDKVDTVDKVVSVFNTSSMTKQEIAWLEEARRNGEFDPGYYVSKEISP